MDASLVTLSSGNVVCAIPECNASLSFNVLHVLDHFKAYHLTTVVPKRPALTAFLHSLALQLLSKRNQTITCSVCLCLVSSTESSIRTHLKHHHVRNIPDSLIENFLDSSASNGSSTTTSTSTSVPQPAMATRVLSLYCNDHSCDFATPLTTLSQHDAQTRMLYHFKRKHTAAVFTSEMTLSQRAASCATGYGVFIGRRFRKETPSFATPSTVVGSPLTMPPVAVLLPSTVASPAATAMLASLPPSSTSTVPSFTATSAAPTSPTFDLSSSVLVSSSSLRDDFTGQVMSSRYPTFHVDLDVVVSSAMKLSERVINSASPLYYNINWWVTDAWYKEICIEGALAWFNLLQPNSTNSGVASAETLLNIAQCLLETAIYCAGLGRMVHPGVAGGLSISSSLQGNADDEFMTSSIDRRYGLSIIQPATRQRYAKELVKVLVYLNNVCIRNHCRALFRADLDNTDVAVGAGLIFQVLFDMEWPVEPLPIKLGTLAQVAAATCLLDSRRSDEASHPLSVEDLSLVPASRVAATCSALMYVIKSLMVINKRHASVKNRTVFFESSRSGPQLAKVKLDYDGLPETEQVFQNMMLYDFVASKKRQSPVYLFCSTGIVGEGASQIGILEISAAVNHAVNYCSQTLTEILQILQMNESIADLLTQMSTNLIFDVKATLGHFKVEPCPSGDHLRDDLRPLCTKDLGQYLTTRGSLFYQRQQQSQEYKRLLRLLRDFEDHLVFLVHVSSGGPGRAQDLFDVFLQQSPTGGSARYLTESTIKLDSVVHKRPNHQHSSTERISRYPTYFVAKHLSTYVAIVRGLFLNHDRLWSPMIKDEASYIQCFNRGASSSFRVSFQFNLWRHVAQLLVSKGDGEITHLAAVLHGRGAKSYQSIASESELSAGEPSVPNTITRQFGHSTKTAIASYKTRALTAEDWRMSSRAYQTWLQLPGIDPKERLDPHDKELQKGPSLFSIHAQYNADHKEQYVLDLLARAFPSSLGTREPSPKQVAFVTAALEGEADVVVIGGCGTGKSAAYLATGIAAQDHGLCILLLCPQNNVALCAEEMCRLADLNYLRIDDSDETKQCVQEILSSEGTALSVGVFITTFETIAQCPTFTLLINALRRYNLLSRVIVDEVHICLSSYSWRMCFNACGHLPTSIGPTIPWVFTTATLPEVAMAPYRRFWHLGSRPHAIMRSLVEIPSNIFVRVEALLSKDSFITKLQGILRSWLKPLPVNDTTTDCKAWVAARVMVLCLTKREVMAVTAKLNEQRSASGLGPDELISAVTADTSNVETLLAIRKAKIIVCTTVLSSSMNIPKLNAIIVFKSTYSMADLVQAWGRVGRDGSPSKAILLWSTVSHTNIFPPDAHDAEAASLAWTPCNFRLRNALRQTFSPSGVLAFVQSKTCRRLQISKLFNDKIHSSSAKDCMQAFEESGIAYNTVYCDVCLVDATNIQRSLLDDFNDGAGFSEDLEQCLPSSGVSASQPNEPLNSGSPPKLRLDDSKDDDEDDGDDVDVDFILCDEGPMPGDEGSKLGTAIFTQVHGLLETLAPMGAHALQCFMCKSSSCQGIRDERLSRACTGREIISTYRHNFVCYGCGGSHSRDSCKFRPPNTQPPVPQALKRCYQCYLPQHAHGSVSFHSTESQTSGSGAACLSRGKVIFGMLTAAFSCKPQLLQDFADTYSAFVLAPPPQAASTNRFSEYWEWMWQFSPLKYQVLHLDIWLLFLLEQCS